MLNLLHSLFSKCFLHKKTSIHMNRGSKYLVWEKLFSYNFNFERSHNTFCDISINVVCSNFLDHIVFDF